MPGPRDFIDPPLFTPGGYGLLSVADPVTNPPGHWQNGVNFQPMCVSGAGTFGTYDECIAITGSASGVGAAVPPNYLTNLVNAGIKAAMPFTISVEFDCAAVGNDAARETANAALAKLEPSAVEQAFWTGRIPGQSQMTVWPHLAADTQVVDVSSPTNPVTVQTVAVEVSGSGTNAVEVVGALEKALGACYGGVGVIHVGPDVLDTLAANNLITRNGSRLFTPNGNKIAVGGGYTGSSPSGAAPPAGGSWAYATGNVNYVRGPVRFRGTDTEMLDRAENTRRMIADRTYLIFWDCCHFAGLITGLGAPKGN